MLFSYLLYVCVCNLSLYMYSVLFVCIHQQYTHTSIMHSSTTHTHTSMTGTIMLPGSPWVPCNTAMGTNEFFMNTRNHHCLSRVSGLSARLLPDQFLVLSSSHYCWGTGFGANTVTRPGLGAILLSRPLYLSTGLTQNCVSPH